MLRDVELEGQWNGEGQPVTWSGMVSSADMALTSWEDGMAGRERPWQRLVLRTEETIAGWMVERSGAPSMAALEGDDVRMNLTEAALGDGRSEVPLSGQLTSDAEGFSLALTSERMPCRRRTPPSPSVQSALAPVLRGMEGQVALDVAIGRLPESRWLDRPREWGLEWRLGRSGGAEGREPGGGGGVGSNGLEDNSRRSVWPRGGRPTPCLGFVVGGGEFAGRVEAWESAGRMDLALVGRGVFRPAGPWPWLPVPEEAPWTALEVKAGGL